MNKDNFENCYFESTIVLLPTFVIGFPLAAISGAPWGLSIGETVALLVASFAFFSSLYHFYAQRKYNRLSVKPYFQIMSSFDSVTEEGFYTFRVQLQNFGLGPGIITDKKLILDTVEPKDIYEEFEEWIKLVNKTTLANGNAECRSSLLEKNQAVDKSSTIDILQANFPKNDISFMDSRDLAMALADKIHLTINYKCHYERNYVCTK